MKALQNYALYISKKIVNTIRVSVKHSTCTSNGNTVLYSSALYMTAFTRNKDQFGEQSMKYVLGTQTKPWECSNELTDLGFHN